MDKIDISGLPVEDSNKKQRMNSNASFTINLHRKGMGAEHDDVIIVSPFQEDFKITYKGKHEDVHHFMYVTPSELVRYVEDLFYLLPSDADAFEFIQFSFPCFPSVMYKVVDFDSKTADYGNKVVRHTVRDRLHSLIHSWPERVRSARRR